MRSEEIFRIFKDTGLMNPLYKKFLQNLFLKIKIPIELWTENI